MTQPHNIAAILQAHAPTMPEALAIAVNRQSTTFQELDAAASRAAMLLRQSGLNLGDAALIVLPLSVDLVVAVLAALRLGMVAIWVDPTGRASLQKTLAQSCHLYAPQTLIARSKDYSLRRKLPELRQIPFKFALGLPVLGVRPWKFDRCLPYEAIANPLPATPALITFTPESQAVIHRHGDLLGLSEGLSVVDSSDPCGICEAARHLTLILVLANLASGSSSAIA